MTEKERPYESYEGELSRTLTFLGAGALGVQDASGLAIDVLNTWVDAQMQFTGWKRSQEEFVRLLEEPISSYASYYTNNGYIKYLDQIMSITKPEALIAFDDQVREYNSLSLERKKGGVVMEYEERCRRIIEGGVGSNE